MRSQQKGDVVRTADTFAVTKIAADFSDEKNCTFGARCSSWFGSITHDRQ